jgi:hypothetical protein
MAVMAASYAHELARGEAYKLEEVKERIAQVKKLIDEVKIENQKLTKKQSPWSPLKNG